ncbi:hypothetical protein V2O64_09500 [Verrucomicrobiaceae bacterium 227]
MSSPRPLESLKPVHELAARRKRLALVAGFTFVGAAIALILLVAAYLDTRLVLGSTLRWGVLLVGALCSLVAGGAAWRRGRAQSVGVAALAFENAHPDVGQRIRTTLGLEGAPENTSLDSLALRRQLSRETAHDLKTRSWKPLVPTRWVAGASIALVAVLGTFAMGLKKSPDLRLGVKRILSPSSGLTYTDIAWDQLPGDFDERRPVRLGVTVSRRVSEPRIFLRDPARPESDWEEISLTRLSESGKWDAILTNRRTDLEIYAEAGDARTPVKRLNYHPIPRLLTSRVNLKYPDYIGLPDQSLEQGDVKEVEGTEVEWEFTFDHPPLKTEWHLGTAGTVTLTGDSGTGVYRAKGQLEVGSLNASLTVYAYDGEPLDAWRYRVTGVADQLPVVKVLEPKDGVKATSITELPVRIRATDDHGVSEIGVVLESIGERDWILEEVVDASDQKRLDAVVNAMLEKVPVTIRDSVRLHAYALDHKPRGGPRAVSPLISIEIVPFKQRWQWGGRARPSEDGGEDSGEDTEALQEALMKLSAIVKQQRTLVSETFVLKETSRSTPKAELAPLLSKEQTLSSHSLRLAEQWNAEGRIAEDDVNLLSIAGGQMNEAAQYFDKRKTRDAFTSADRALSNLLQLRKKFINLIMEGGDGTPLDPGDVPPALSDLAKEAERLADEELDVRQQLQDGEPKLEVLRRQQEVVVADTGELYARLVDHHELNQGALILMDEAEKAVRAADEEVQTDQPEQAIGQLADAENVLRDLAQFLRALEMEALSEALRELAEKAEQNGKDAKSAAEAEAEEEKQAGKESGEKPGAKPGAKPGGGKPGGNPGAGGEKPAGVMLADAARETELADQILKALAENAAAGAEGKGDAEGAGEGEKDDEGLAELREELAAGKLAEKLAGLGQEAGEGTLDEEGRSRTKGLGKELEELSRKLKEAAAQIDASKLSKLMKARDEAKAVEKAIAQKDAKGNGEGDQPGEGEGDGEGLAEGGKGGGGHGAPMNRFADSLKKSGNPELRQWATRIQDFALDENALLYVNHIRGRIDQLISELPTPAAREAAPTRIPEDRRREIEDYFRDLSDDFSDEGWSAQTE